MLADFYSPNVSFHVNFNLPARRKKIFFSPNESLLRGGKSEVFMWDPIFPFSDLHCRPPTQPAPSKRFSSPKIPLTTQSMTSFPFTQLCFLLLSSSTVGQILKFTASLSLSFVPPNPLRAVVSCRRHQPTSASQSKHFRSASKLSLIFVFSDYFQMASRTSNHHFLNGAKTNARTTCNRTQPSS